MIMTLYLLCSKSLTFAAFKNALYVSKYKCINFFSEKKKLNNFKKVFFSEVLLLIDLNVCRSCHIVLLGGINQSSPKMENWSTQATWEKLFLVIYLAYTTYSIYTCKTPLK